ncbi:MAG: hypothetical protein VKM92_09615, partial [Cyanobacteriota bacterium]|nr:hypothetical protein [Cyanobacteriota bacterium]
MPKEFLTEVDLKAELRAAGSAGSSGQVLQSQGSGQPPTWAAAGSSSGTKTYAVFTPSDNQPPSSGFATLDTRNSVAVLDFDAAATESAVFVGV